MKYDGMPIQDIIDAVNGGRTSRFYQLWYRLPHKHADGSSVKWYDDMYKNRLPWPPEMHCITLAAYDASEAWARLEYRLLRQNYFTAGQPSHAIYERYDIKPSHGPEQI